MIHARIDIAVHIGQIADSNWTACPLCEFDRILYGTPAYVERRGLRWRASFTDVLPSLTQGALVRLLPQWCFTPMPVTAITPQRGGEPAKVCLAMATACWPDAAAGLATEQLSQEGSPDLYFRFTLHKVTRHSPRTRSH